MPLSCDSVADRSTSVDVPDFTRGAWKTNAPLEIVDVDPARLPVRRLDTGAGQLEVH